MPTNKNPLLAKIHIAKAQLGLTMKRTATSFAA